MSNLPGNPYADALTDYTDPRNSIEALATLALAYEQRTANLIAYVVGIDDTSATIPVVNEIRARLGLGTAK
ncbi:hypothetical protein BLJ79_21515 [Arthrobacter sp. UCD-GKA]|uniref:hypothetical protein n=1 Tax=Arthrobacter sp. UCD-GKA TaxID=1913576 RepID=UPI0008DE7160|nr:hypothetical protein [Arthrobacter sp. UCD-GKA]OIH81941.1 hypothetical protein BLJ79_21515 [Arthrobacter sp. UCD-GKA]